MPTRRYEVRIAGRLPSRLRATFVGMDVAPVPPETVIAGTVDDQHAAGARKRGAPRLRVGHLAGSRARSRPARGKPSAAPAAG